MCIITACQSLIYVSLAKFLECKLSSPFGLRWLMQFVSAVLNKKNIMFDNEMIWIVKYIQVNMTHIHIHFKLIID